MTNNNCENVNIPVKNQGAPMFPVALIVVCALCMIVAVTLHSALAPYNNTILYETPIDTYTDTYTDLLETFTDVIESSVDESSDVSSVAESSVETESSYTPPPQSVVSTPAVVENNIINYKSRQTYSMMWNGIEKLYEEYSDILSYTTYGKSTKGRNLFLVKIGTGNKKGLIVAGMHGTEHITTTYALRCIEDYCRAYVDGGSYGKYNVKDLLSKYTLYIVPNCNPDGSEIAHNGDSPLVSVKGFSDRSDSAYYKANANGVNLNRNFPFYFNSLTMPSSVPHLEDYKGTSGASEVETQKLIELCNANSFQFMLTLHVRGNLTYWSDSVTPNAGGISDGLCSKYSSELGLRKEVKTTNVNDYAGGFENWFRYTYQRPGICVELMPTYYSITGSSSGNEQNFDNVVRWSSTKYLFALTMDYVG